MKKANLPAVGRGVRWVSFSILVAMMTWFAVTPVLWIERIQAIQTYLARFGNYAHNTPIAFDGSLISPRSVRWNYLPSWCIITTSSATLLLLLIGLGVVISYGFHDRNELLWSGWRNILRKASS